jgi:hypothetical protein
VPLAIPNGLVTTHDTSSTSPASPEPTTYVNDAVVAVDSSGRLHDTARDPDPTAVTVNVTVSPTAARLELTFTDTADGGTHTRFWLGLGTVGQLSSEFACPSPSLSAPHDSGLSDSTA